MIIFFLHHKNQTPGINMQNGCQVINSLDTNSIQLTQIDIPTIMLNPFQYIWLDTKTETVQKNNIERWVNQ